MEYEIDFITAVYGGETLGRLPDGRAVFVPFVLPGERGRVRLVEDKKGYARGALMELLRASPERITPRCIHFAICGGCHYQQIDYARQLELKSAVLRDQFTRIAGVAQPPLRACVPAPEAWNYRNGLQFHLNAQGRLGFLAADGSGVMALDECHLPEAALNALWPQLEFEPLPGLERIALRQGADGDALMVLESDGLQVPQLSVEELPVSVVHLGPAGTLVMAGADGVVMEILGRPFRVSAGSFFQVNTAMAEKMVSYLLETLPLDPGSNLLDLYCGVGLFSAFFAGRCAQVVGVESSGAACADFAANLDEFENVSLYEGEAGQVLPGLEGHFEVALVDPPRAGLERSALDALLRLAPETLVYISCDPATLARDAKRLLAGGYGLEEVTPFDLFPQTYHIESISIFKHIG
jgi:23S rRNA (uracil1939-C5)-methyltransferase